MNEKYGPVLVRFGVILLGLIVGAVALMKYVENREERFLAAEEERAKRLGWLTAPTLSKRVSPAEIEATAAQSEAFAALRKATAKDPNLTSSPFMWLDLESNRAIRLTDEMAGILSQHLPALEETVKQILATPNPRLAERKHLVYAMSGRALAFANTNQPEAAFGTLRIAWALAEMISPDHVQYNQEQDAVVRTVWCQVAMLHPDKVSDVIADSPVILRFGRQSIHALIAEQFGEGREGMGMNAPAQESRRTRFFNLKTGSGLFEQLAANSADLYATWRYLKGKNAAYTFHRSATKTDPENLAAYLRDQAVREQLCQVFFSYIKRPSNPPTALSGTRDPFNSSKPLKFVKTKDGFSIYSVGIDGVDNKGNHGDIAIKVTKQDARAALETNGIWR